MLICFTWRHKSVHCCRKKRKKEWKGGIMSWNGLYFKPVLSRKKKYMLIRYKNILRLGSCTSEVWVHEKRHEKRRCFACANASYTKPVVWTICQCIGWDKLMRQKSLFFYRFHFLIPKCISYIYSLCSQYSDSLLIVVSTAGLERNWLYCCHNKIIPTIKQLLSILVYFLVEG